MTITVWVQDDEGNEPTSMRKTFESADAKYDKFTHALILAERAFRVTPY